MRVSEVKIVNSLCYGNFTSMFCDDLAARLKGRRVLEVFAGNGMLAALLAARGTRVTATSMFSSHDGHERGMNYPVIKAPAVSAVWEYGEDHDTLLMSWPTTDEGAYRAALAWGAGRDIVYVGEVTSYEVTPPILASCASDMFFEKTRIVEEIASYSPRNLYEKAAILRLR